jgi:hypothetical protein
VRDIRIVLADGSVVDATPHPRADEFFALKKRFDPSGKFRNELLSKYGPR